MSKAGWTSPSEPWDRHPRPMARTALQAARKAGWWLNKSNAGAKVWGMITCGDPDLPGDERCRTIVHSTSGSSDGSETAEFIDNVVRKCPHDWATPEVVDPFADAERREAIEGTLLKREGSPEHVAAAVLALVQNDFITGVCLPVDGGRTLAG